MQFFDASKCFYPSLVSFFGALRCIFCILLHTWWPLRWWTSSDHSLVSAVQSKKLESPLTIPWITCAISWYTFAIPHPQGKQMAVCIMVGNFRSVRRLSVYLLYVNVILLCFASSEFWFLVCICVWIQESLYRSPEAGERRALRIENGTELRW